MNNCSILDYINNNNFFFKHVSPEIKDELLKYGMIGSHGIRLFRDVVTDSFVSNLFENKENLYLFIDYCFYEIFTDIKININFLLNKNNYPCLKENENVDLLFKGGNIMSFFYDSTKTLLKDHEKKNIEYNTSKIPDVFTKHKLLNDDEYNTLKSVMTKDETIKDYLDNQQQNFKLSDVDFTLVINSDNEIYFSVLDNLSGKILTNSLMKIKDKFNEYYENIRNENNKFIININTFIFNDDPNNQKCIMYYDFIKKLRNEINDIFNKRNQDKSTKISINNDIKSTYFKNIYYAEFILILAKPNSKYYVYDKSTDEVTDKLNEEYNNVKNIRLVTYIYEYLILIKIYDSYISFLDETNKNYLKSLLTGIEIIKRFHISNKFNNLVKNNFYNLEIINKFLHSVSEKYNLANPNSNKALYEERYATSYNNGLIINTYKLNRKNNNTPFIFNDLKKNILSNKNNEIDIVSKDDSLVYCDNSLKIYNGQTFYVNNNYHYITYNNVIWTSNKLASYSFDLYRIKFCVRIVKPLVLKDKNKMTEMDIPSEFIDVSISKFIDTMRKHFIEEIKHDDGKIGIYNINKDKNIMFWNAYTIEQLFFDISSLLFNGLYLLPWYDNKYNKRITRMLLLYLLYQVNNDTNKPENNFKWISVLIRILKLFINIKIYIKNNGKGDFPFNNVSKILVMNDNENKEIQKNITKNILDNCYLNIEYDFRSIFNIKKEYFYFEYLIRIVIFYSYYMFKPNFLSILNSLRKNSNMPEYKSENIEINGEMRNIVEVNNNKFNELIDIVISNLTVIIMISLHYK
jgi:hypothetical protein